jgi:hypothetical protein
MLRIRKGCLTVTVSRRERMVMHACLPQVSSNRCGLPRPCALVAAIASTIVVAQQSRRSVSTQHLPSLLPLSGRRVVAITERLNRFDR